MTAPFASHSVPWGPDKDGTRLCRNGTKASKGPAAPARTEAGLRACRNGTEFNLANSLTTPTPAAHFTYALTPGPSPTIDQPAWHAFRSVPRRTAGLRFVVKHTGRCQGINGAMKHKNSHLLVGYW